MTLRLVFVLFALSALSVAFAQKTTARAATLEDSARTEDEVVLYSSLNNF